MVSTSSLLNFLLKAETIAQEEGLPSAKAGLLFMQKIEQERANENEQKQEERNLWQEKNPAVAQYYHTHPNAEIDPDDVAEYAGLPKSRGNRTRISRELRLLGYDKSTCQIAAE